MSEKYYVSSGNGAKEIEIPEHQDPFKEILKKAEAPRTSEKAKDAPLTAGDEIVVKSKEAFAGKEEGVAETPKDIIYGHCNNCRLELTEDKVVKQPIEFHKNEDGSYSQTATRFSVFCKSCMKFITLIDKVAADLLEEMTRKGLKK